MDVADGERVRELSAADLTAVRRLDLHPVFQPFVGDAFVVDGDLKGDGVPFLSVQVLQHGGDQDGCSGQVRGRVTTLKRICINNHVFFWFGNDDQFLCVTFSGDFWDLNLRLTVRVADTLSFPQMKVYSAESSLLVFMIFSWWSFP